ncbi:DUF1659 domain-containing protein [Clostridium sp.]|uniref:DUF1659 domain-containing protein n=1 Tax=Clostridium sp. TaxID=1506 RepID=UPI003F80471B
MAITREDKVTSLLIEIENGTDSKGQTIYKKKTISNVNPNLSDANLYAFANQVAGILTGEHRYFYANDTSVLQNDFQQ